MKELAIADEPPVPCTPQNRVLVFLLVRRREMVMTFGPVRIELFGYQCGQTRGCTLAHLEMFDNDRHRAVLVDTYERIQVFGFTARASAPRMSTPTTSTAAPAARRLEEIAPIHLHSHDHASNFSAASLTASRMRT